MNFLRYFTLLSLLFFSTACVGDKKPKKMENNNSSSHPYAYLEPLDKEQKNLLQELIDYITALKIFDTDTIVEKTYPNLFSYIDQTHFRKYISTMMNSKDIVVKEYDAHINKISKVVTFTDKTQLAKVAYTSTTKILLLNDKLYNTERSMNFLYDVLIHKYGKENIEIDVKKRTLSIKKREYLLMINDKGEGWKFLGNNAEYQNLYPSILPIEINNYLEVHAL
jgi:dihydroxyacetone kinase-like predicted kinase